MSAVELVAEGKDELMEEFFREGTIPEQHLIAALHEAIREDRIFPVLYASGLRTIRHRTICWTSSRFTRRLRPREAGGRAHRRGAVGARPQSCNGRAATRKHREWRRRTADADGACR